MSRACDFFKGRGDIFVDREEDVSVFALERLYCCLMNDFLDNKTTRTFLFSP